MTGGLHWRPTAALRGALWITLIALVATSLALTVQYIQTIRLLETRVQAAVDDEAAGLVDRYNSDGPVAVVQAVMRAVDRPRLTDFVYLMTDADGTPIVGNLAEWPAGIHRAGYTSFDTRVQGARGTSIERRVSARALRLGEYRLLVGSLSNDPGRLRGRYAAALFWSLLVTGLVGLLAGFWYSRRATRFLDAANRAGERFRAGQLGERMPVSARDDEYDRLAVTVNHSFAEVERLVASLRTATDALAHDLKTPLTRMRARLELAALQQDGASFADDLRHDLDALLRLIDDTLRLAHVEAAGASAFARVDLEAIVRETVELFDPVAQDCGVTLTAEGCGTGQAVVVDGLRPLLGQMVANLVDNAVKYTPPGGRITVALSAAVDGTVRLSVTDSGPGIPAGQRDHALGRFVRLDPSRSTPGGGLGLSIVAAVAHVHRARLQLDDADPGLIVRIDFPAPEDR
ncbi:ATP-binding protein [Sphingomonas sp.]|uniref:sensor histidine kinase n=1 Tax=Sphingomonas sp. TaxID=28214 RepID=UPI0035B3B39C